MELHRSEMVAGNEGALIPLTIFGLAPHEGSMREDILKLKFGNNRRVAQSLAELLALRLTHGEMLRNIDVITWAPTTSARKITRGYDQAELLARHLGAYVNIPVKTVVRRVSTTSQAGAQRAVRLLQPEFVAKPTVKNKSVVVVDDVTTTGSTFRAAASALAARGCTHIVCVAPSWKP